MFTQDLHPFDSTQGRLWANLLRRLTAARDNKPAALVAVNNERTRRYEKNSRSLLRIRKWSG